MTGTNCDLFTHKQSRSYLNHLVFLQQMVLFEEVSYERIDALKEVGVAYFSYKRSR
jgi:hypothetical protein